MDPKPTLGLGIWASLRIGGLSRKGYKMQCLQPLASFNLEVDAKLWFQLLKEETHVISWDHFKHGLQSWYRPTQYQDFFGDLTKLQQMGSIRDYHTEFERLLIRVGKLSPEQ